MLTVRLPDNLDSKLELYASDMHIAKSKIVIEALARYFEDLEDYLQAKKALMSNEPVYSHEEVERELGL